MTKEEFCALLAEIGGVGEIVGQEAEDARKRSELDVNDQLNQQYGPLLLRGDATHQFYVDTVRALYRRLSESVVEDERMHYFSHWHALSASRYFIAFDLFRRGYYLECIALARTLWETALTMAGIQKGVVPLEEVFGGRSEAGKSLSASEIRKCMKAADRAIQKKLLWENPALDGEARDALKTFLWTANQSVHKSNLGMVVAIQRQQEKQGIHIFPYFDRTLSEVSANTLFLAVWCLVATLEYLKALLPQEGSSWAVRYQKLRQMYEHLDKNPPNEVCKGFGSLVKKIF